VSLNYLRPGTVVMVAVGTISAAMNNQLPVICMATVVGRADEHHWWLDVRTGMGDATLRQRYADTEILGVPGFGLVMVADHRCPSPPPADG